MLAWTSPWAWAVAALVTSGGLVLVWWRWASTVKHPASSGRLPMLCPRCRRAYPLGTVYCPFDAARLGQASAGASASPALGGRCVGCHRAFEAGVRFCPFDGEELAPHVHVGEAIDFADAQFVGASKICPLCAAKYDDLAGFCGRDAHELVSVN